MSSSMADGPDKDWDVRRDSYSVGEWGDDWRNSNTYTCTKYQSPFQWFTLTYVIRRRATLVQHHCYYKRNVSMVNIQSLSKALAWADEHIALTLKHQEIIWGLRDLMKPEASDCVYRLEGQTLIPHATVFAKICGGTAALARGETNLFAHCENRWSQGDYYVVEPSGRISHVSIDGSSTSSGTIQTDKERFPVARRIFRWTSHGLPEVSEVVYQWGAEVVVIESGLHGIVIGVPISYSGYDLKGNKTYQYQLHNYRPRVCQKDLCTPEEYAALCLAR